jgi:hypothetical protein
MEGGSVMSFVERMLAKELLLFIRDAGSSLWIDSEVRILWKNEGRKLWLVDVSRVIMAL